MAKTQTKEQRLFHPVKYKFDNEESHQLGLELARENARWYELKAQKTAAGADFTAQLKVVDAKVNELQIKLNNGYEYRSLECIVVMDTPKKGYKRIVRADTGEIVDDEVRMTDKEMQQSLDFD